MASAQEVKAAIEAYGRETDQLKAQFDAEVSRRNHLLRQIEVGQLSSSILVLEKHSYSILESLDKSPGIGKYFVQ